MEMSTETLVILVISLSLITGVMLFGMTAKYTIEESSDVSCASSVIARSAAMKWSQDAQLDLVGCETRYERFEADASDSKMIKRIAKDAHWCYQSFGVERKMDLLKGEETYCHICGLYEKEGGGELAGSAEAIENQILGLSTPTEEPYVPEPLEDDFVPVESEQSHEFPIAVIFIQEKTENLTFLGNMLKATGQIDGTGTQWDDAVAVLKVLEKADLAYTVVSIGVGVASGGTGTAAMIGFRTALKKSVTQKVQKAAREAAEKALAEGLEDQARRAAMETARRRVLMGSTAKYSAKHAVSYHLRHRPWTARTKLAMGGATYIGGFIGEEKLQANGIVISSYTQEQLRDFGCTTSKPQ